MLLANCWHGKDDQVVGFFYGFSGPYAPVLFSNAHPLGRHLIHAIHMCTYSATQIPHAKAEWKSKVTQIHVSSNLYYNVYCRRSVFNHFAAHMSNDPWTIRPKPIVAPFAIRQGPSWWHRCVSQLCSSWTPRKNWGVFSLLGCWSFRALTCARAVGQGGKDGDICGALVTQLWIPMDVLGSEVMIIRPKKSA